MAWVIRSLKIALKDPFVRARLKTTFFYFLFMLVVLSTSGYILDSVLRNILVEAHQPGASIVHDELADRIQRIRTILRLVNIAIFTVAAYVLIGFTFRPIRELLSTQRRFIANVSHELRTPLAVMRTETEVALRHAGDLTREDAIALAEKNLERSAHVSRIVDFFLLMSDYDSSRTVRGNRTVSLSAAILPALRRLADEAEEKGVDLTIDARPELCVEGNAIALSTLVVNLVRNAIAHTPPGGTVRAGVRGEGGEVILTVADTGTGIPAADLPRIFEPFFRGRGASDAGSGLGLSIVKEVARLHGATITVDSEEGYGAVFMVKFRKSRDIPTVRA